MTNPTNMESMTRSLDELSSAGELLSVGRCNAEVFARLKRAGTVRLSDARDLTNSLEGRFDLAYNAAHALCLAALRWHGYRPTNRYVVFQVLPHTLGLGPEVWRVLAKCHEVRNIGEYEGDLNVDERLVAGLIAACEEVASKLETLKARAT